MIFEQKRNIGTSLRENFNKNILRILVFVILYTYVSYIFVIIQD